MADKTSRQQAILEAFARELEQHPGERVTTAKLAKALGVSEAALYRHFPSKARMFEGLIEFAEETIFTLINRIMDEETDPIMRCEKVMALVLGFCAKNPGISSVLAGAALTGETARLRDRVGQFFERLETQFRQILREGELKLMHVEVRPVNEVANLLLAMVEGRIAQYIRSGFKQSPIAGWQTQWLLLQRTLQEYKLP